MQPRAQTALWRPTAHRPKGIQTPQGLSLKTLLKTKEWGMSIITTDLQGGVGVQCK